MDSSNNTHTIFFVGKAGSGKGTQAKLLSEKLGWTFFSTGEQFREIREQESVLGKKVRDTIDAGYMCPGWFSGFLFKQTILNLPSEEGIVCEGSLRSVEETKSVEEALVWLERPFKVFFLIVDEDMVIERLQKRAIDEGREDDADIESIKKRFAEFEKNTKPAIEYLKEKGVLIEINGMRTQEEVHNDILEQLGKQ